MKGPNGIYDVSIFVIDNNGDAIYINDYDRVEDGDGMFLSLTNDRLNSDYGEDNTINISHQWKHFVCKNISEFGCCTELHSDYDFSSCGITWMKGNLQLPKTLQTGNLSIFQWSRTAFYQLSLQNKNVILRYLNGYKDTQDIILNVDRILNSNTPLNIKETWGKREIIPAIMAAYSNVIIMNDKRCQGYLPSIGQLLYISKNIIEIEKAMIKSNGDLLTIYEICRWKGQWWTSTMFDEILIWVMKDGEVTFENRALEGSSGGYVVFPLFKI